MSNSAEQLEKATNAAVTLGVATSNAELGTDLALKAGEQPTRHYHNVGHFAAMMAGADSIKEKLLARGIGEETAEQTTQLYLIATRDHDVVYINADGRIPETISGSLDPFIEKDAQGVYHIRSAETLATLSPLQQENIALILAAFGFEPGQALSPFTGQNEFLSALHSLEINKGLSADARSMIAGMIQATIPFDSPDSVQKLVTRLQQKTGLDEDASHALGLAAADIANRDVIKFATDPAQFHADSLCLLREGGANLKNPESILQHVPKMAGFFQFLSQNPGSKPVYRNYSFTSPQGEPVSLLSSEELETMNQSAQIQITDGIARLNAMKKVADRSVRENEVELPGADDGKELVKRANRIMAQELKRREPRGYV